MRRKVLLSLFLLVFVYGWIFSQTTHKIQVSNYQFSPSSLTGVKIGDTIEWDWLGGDHTVTSVTIPANASSFNYNMNSTSTVAHYNITEAGTYNYKCQFHAPEMVGSFVVDASASISSISFSKMSIEPNPAHDFVNVKLGTAVPAGAKIIIYDLLGRQVLSEEMKINESSIFNLDISNLKSGIYLIMLNAEKLVSKPYKLIKR